jgi:hypothetical protein
VITPFLVIRSASNVAFTIIYVYLAHPEQKSTGVTTAVLLGVTSVVVYTGLVVVGFKKDWDCSPSSQIGVDQIGDKIGSTIEQSTT